jgi:hypothetical protein
LYPFFSNSISTTDEFILEIISYDLSPSDCDFDLNASFFPEIIDERKKNKDIKIEEVNSSQHTFKSLDELKCNDLLFRSIVELPQDNLLAVSKLSEDTIHLCPLIVYDGVPNQKTIAVIGLLYFKQMMTVIGRSIASPYFHDLDSNNTLEAFEDVNCSESITIENHPIVIEKLPDFEIMYSQAQGDFNSLMNGKEDDEVIGGNGSMQLKFDSVPSVVTLFCRRKYLWSLLPIDKNSEITVNIAKPSLLCQPNVNQRSFKANPTDSQPNLLSLEKDLLGKYNVGKEQDNMMNTALGYDEEKNLSTHAFYAMPFDSFDVTNPRLSSLKERYVSVTNKALIVSLKDDNVMDDDMKKITIEENKTSTREFANSHTVLYPMEVIPYQEKDCPVAIGLQPTQIKVALEELFGLNGDQIESVISLHFKKREDTPLTHTATFLLYYLMVLVEEHYDGLSSKVSWIKLSNKLFEIWEMRIAASSAAPFRPYQKKIPLLLASLSFTELRIKVLFIWSSILYPTMSLSFLDGAGRVGSLSYSMIRRNIPSENKDITALSAYTSMNEITPTPKLERHMRLHGEKCKLFLFSSGCDILSSTLLIEARNKSSQQQHAATNARKTTIFHFLEKLVDQLKAKLSGSPIARRGDGMRRFYKPDCSSETLFRESMLLVLNKPDTETDSSKAYFEKIIKSDSNFSTDSFTFNWTKTRDFVQKQGGENGTYHDGRTIFWANGKEKPLAYEGYVTTLPRSCVGLSLPEILNFHGSTASYIYALFFGTQADEMEGTMQHIHSTNTHMKKNPYNSRHLRQAHAVHGSNWIAHLFRKCYYLSKNDLEKWGFPRSNH